MEDIRNTKIKISYHHTEFFSRDNWRLTTHKLWEGTIGELAEGPEFLTEGVNEYFKKLAKECIETGDLEHFLKSGYEKTYTDNNIWITSYLVK